MQQYGGDSRRQLEDGTAADSGAPEIEEHDNHALNPYSEQWLRNLPKDPGGYMRRKFHYQAQMRQQKNAGAAPVVAEGRY